MLDRIAHALLLTDDGARPRDERTIPRIIFLDPRTRAAQPDWEGVARFVVGAFRADVEPLVDELCRLSPIFAALWRDNDVRGPHGDVVKLMRHPVAGPVAFESSAFGGDGRTDLNKVVYHPATAESADRIRALMPA